MMVLAVDAVNDGNLLDVAVVVLCSLVLGASLDMSSHIHLVVVVLEVACFEYLHKLDRLLKEKTLELISCLSSQCYCLH